MQYTLRNVPDNIDRALREKARREGKSLNRVAIEALAHALEVATEELPRRDLSDVAGSWVDDAEVDAAIAEQRAIDSELWR